MEIAQISILNTCQGRHAAGVPFGNFWDIPRTFLQS